MSHHDSMKSHMYAHGVLRRKSEKYICIKITEKKPGINRKCVCFTCKIKLLCAYM